MDRQKEVLNAFKEGEVLSKNQIKERSGISYYYNTDKHLGDVLSRMVKNGLLIRIKKGYYQWLGRTVPNHKAKEIIQPKNQTKLF